MSRSADIAFFARHEWRLQWRDILGLLTRGGPRNRIFAGLSLLALAAGIQYLAWLVVGPWARAGITPNAETLARLTGSGLLFLSMALSQALESVTRAYYTRNDLDLILSSPISAGRLFAVRSGAIALTGMALTGLLALPFVNVLIVNAGPQWLAVFAVIGALSLIATALAIFITLALFRLFGPKRTRLVAQILAGIIGAALVVGIQLAAFASTKSTAGAMSSLSHQMLTMAPDPQSLLFLPARAAMGDPVALALTLGLAIALIGFAIPVSAKSFAPLAIAATSLAAPPVTHRKAKPFRTRSARAHLIAKEWVLLWRDPWLISQSLMQLLYLIPPAVLLWINFGAEKAALPVVVAIVTMASGQLAGGLAWLTLSGEDAPDLIASAPVSPALVIAAKTEAVLGLVLMVTGPILLGLALTAPEILPFALCGIGLAASSAILIQRLFRTRAKRAQFARRQTASRISTVIEALVSINWAGAAALAATHLVLGLVAALPALLILLVTWLVRRKAEPA